MVAVLTGLIAGTLHVWSGPDHLAAVAPIAVRSRGRSWLAGLRWGVGHSAGVALVGALSLWLRELLPMELLSAWGEQLVGVMLIGIGFWGLRKAARQHLHLHAHQHDGETHVHLHVHERRAGHDAAQAHVHTHAALGIGILHGLAGSSHFFGVLPALAFPTLTQALSYILAYAAGTVASMILFAAVVGLAATRFALGSNRAYAGFLAACSTAAVIVGGCWLSM